ncbi:MAG: tetratricopeptide repeat protein, partial [Chloroflexi bacterium]|nr:tetratricopeptide repeat protein [Chloroflexota bacterium]
MTEQNETPTDDDTNIGGDQVRGDKVMGDKVAGNKIVIQPETKRPLPLQSLLLSSEGHFTARQYELSWTLDTLQPKRIVTLWGPGGIGKSAIAQAVIDTLSTDNKPPETFPDGIIAHSFYGQPSTASFAAHIVKSLNGETALDISPAAAKRALANKNLLLVLDGTEEATDLNAVLGLCGDCGVLITTRNKGDARSPKWRLPIKKLTLDDAWLLLQKWHIEEMSEQLGRQLCQFVDGWPLAISIIGQYLDATSEPPGEYWTWLQNAPIAALSFGEHRRESVEVLLGRTQERLSDAAKQTLGIVGFLAPAPIGREFILLHITHSEKDAKQAIGELNRYGLIRQQEKQLEIGHALIHAYARRQMPLQKELFLEISEAIQENVSKSHHIPILMLDWLPHLQAVTAYTLEQAEDRASADLCNKLGYALNLIADYDGAKLYFERALAINEKVLGAEHPATALSLNNLGALLDSQGDYDGAKPYYERALEINEKVLGAEHPDTARSLNNLGFLLQAQGDYDGAKPYFERALEINEKVLGAEHPDTALSLNNLG